MLGGGYWRRTIGLGFGPGNRRCGPVQPVSLQKLALLSRGGIVDQSLASRSLPGRSWDHVAPKAYSLAAFHSSAAFGCALPEDAVDGNLRTNPAASASTNDETEEPAVASRPSVDDINAFVVEHSGRFRKEKGADDAATVEGCFPPTIGAERVVQCLGALASLLKETTEAAFTMEFRRRIFWVRDRPLHASLDGFDTEQGLADLQRVLDHMLLPKSLEAALELECDVMRARDEYQAANASYNAPTAAAKAAARTTPKPRLFDFLLGKDRLRELLRSLGDANGPRRPLHSLLSRIMPFDPRATDVVISQAVHDGLMGESLSEYGFAPSKQRVLAYTSGCILARRPIRAKLKLPSQRDAQELSVGSVGPLHPLRAAVDPLAIALEIGSEDAATAIDLKSLGWRAQDSAAGLPHCFRLAGLSGCIDTLEWLYSVDIEAAECLLAFHSFEAALQRGHFDAAQWLVDKYNSHAWIRSRKGWWYTIYAAEHNDLDALEWLHLGLNYPLHPEIVRYACKHGNEEMLDWYFSKAKPGDIERGLSWNWSAFEEGLRAGHLEMSLSLLTKGRPEGNLSVDVLAAACEGSKGDTRFLDSLLAIKPPLPWSPHFGHASAKFSNLAAAAARLGYPHVLEWITKQPGCGEWFFDLDERATAGLMENAVWSGQTDCVRWLLSRARNANDKPPRSRRDRPYPVPAGTTITPSPSQEMLELLAPRYNLSRFHSAAISGTDVGLVRRLGKLGFPLTLRDADLHALLRVIEIGPASQPRLLTFLRCLVDECGLDFSKVRGICLAAARSGSTEVMAFIVENGGKIGKTHGEALLEAATHGQLPMCRWLRKQGVKWPKPQLYLQHKARLMGADEVAAWADAEQASRRTRATKA